ncbi:protein adenylyltransferase SelO [Terriglobus sp. ADX1]|uniref:protein adenylyltransferase SelO n=1 Tax=Terriglobus sp. ADX1 TaxID=2794063 RepID=UPI002FE53A6B
MSSSQIPFQNTYARLPENFYGRTNPAQVPSPRLIRFNEGLAKELNITPGDDLAEIFSGNRIADGSEPLAMAYAGHQFATFVPTLGDGRANLLGEVSGKDIHLKGSGRTPFSRRGDGKAALGPVLREYILSEAMYALGVPTTRALAAVTTGEKVIREEMLPGAVFTRVASSHIRVGTFQYFAAHQDNESVRILADYVIDRHHPEAKETPKKYKAMLQGIVDRQARLIAKWMDLGFIHGVMNTDNTAISGETIDYGPCAFMEQYHPATVFSSIDRNGRYAYQNQPAIMIWNLSRLAECLLPLMQEEEGSEQGALDAAYEVLNSFQTTFERAHINGLRSKLGLATEHAEDLDLAADLLQRMAANQADFTLTFRRLADVLEKHEDYPTASLFRDPSAFTEWSQRWQSRIAQEDGTVEARIASMRAVSPIYIPRNHLVQEVIDAAVLREDFTPFERLLEVTSKPFEERLGLDHYSAPAKPEERVLQTFCGT